MTLNEGGEGKVAATAAAAAAAKAPQPGKRGGGYTQTEDILMSKAFIAASCDSRHGTLQTGKAFQDTMHVNYIQLLAEHEQVDSNRMRLTAAGRDSMVDHNPAAVYDRRTPTAIHERFRKVISRAVMKFVGVTATTEKPSGHNEEMYYQLCKDLYHKRIPNAGSFGDFRACSKYLNQLDKLKTFSALELLLEKEKQSRPNGQKKDKRLKEVKDITTTIVKNLKAEVGTGESGGIASSPFYDKAGKLIECIATSMAQQNEIKLLEAKHQSDMQLFGMLSTPQKWQWRDARFEMAMAETKSKKAAIEHDLNEGIVIAVDDGGVDSAGNPSNETTG